MYEQNERHFHRKRYESVLRITDIFLLKAAIASIFKRHQITYNDVIE